MRVTHTVSLAPIKLACFDRIVSKTATLRGLDTGLTYARKYECAVRYVQSSSEDCAYLEREADLKGLTLYQVAQSILNLSQNWEMRDAKLEELRQKAQMDLEAATQPTDCELITANFEAVTRADLD